MRSPIRHFVFNITIQSVGRALLARDIAFGWARLNWRIDPTLNGVSRHGIRSGRNVLDSVLVEPGSSPARAAVLICHGIGETVQRWFGVQQMLAANGLASLVFDYTGYGRSKGFFSAAQSERDTIAAFEFLEQRVGPLPISLLGFSLGSGIAAAVLDCVAPSSLVLCAAYTSMRAAAHSVGVPKKLLPGVPPIWRAEDVLRTSKVPVLIVHGERDRLFPVSMADELSAACSPRARVVLVPKLRHNEPFHRPTQAYWGVIASFILDSVDLAARPSTLEA